MGYFYLRRFSESRSSSGSTPSVHPSATLKRYQVCVICNSKSFNSFFIQTLPNDCWHLKICTSYFVHVSYYFFRFWGVLNLDIFSSEMLRGCLVCVICNSNSIHSFVFIPNIMIVHTLKMCTFHFVHISYFFYLLTIVELRHFSIRKAECLVCVIWNCRSIHSFIFKLCIIIVHTLKMSTSYFVHISCFFHFFDGCGT